MKETLESRRQLFNELHPEWGKYNIYQEFLHTVDKFSNRLFLIDEEVSQTYGQASEEVDRLAVALYKQGVDKGTHVALCLENSRLFVLISLALYKLGAVKIPTSQKLGERELLYVLNQSDSEYMISQIPFADDFLEKIEGLKIAFAMKMEEVRKVCKKTKCLTDIMDVSSETVLTANTDINQMVDIMYTSGSTSWPKGVMLTDRMLLQSAYANAYNRGYGPERRIFVPIPLNHIFGYVEGVIGAILAGSTLVFFNGRFEAEKALRYMEKYAVNDVLLVPSMAVKMMRSESFDQTDLSSLQAMYCGASICSETLWQEIRDRFHIDEIVTGYGMTELAGATMQNVPGDSVAILKRSLGKLLKYRPIGDIETWIEYKVVDPVTHKDVTDSDSGELWCKGPMVLSGYYKNPEANAAAFTKDRWMKTGDIGWFDENGYLEFVGRSHEQCKVNGENVSLQFLDEIIGNNTFVRAVETVAVRDEKTGYAVMAFVELETDTPKNRQKIVAFSKKSLAVYQMPKYFCFGRRDEWPQTSSLKVQKYQLMQRAEMLLKENPKRYLSSDILNKGTI